MSDEQNTPVKNSPDQPEPVQPAQPPASGQGGKKDTTQILMEELSPDLSGASRRRRIFQTMIIPLLAILTGLILGAVFIVFTSAEFYAALSESLWLGIKTGFSIVAQTYGAWWNGMFGDFGDLLAYFQTGDIKDLYKFWYPISEGLTASTPYIFGGLSVALAFRAGMFNIGAEGQIFVGAVFAAYVGYSYQRTALVPAYPPGCPGRRSWRLPMGFYPRLLKSSHRSA